jgi:FkbM family methyltransferase
MQTSYAQNFEDILLNRIFKATTDGCYVDVGACHPNAHSVTKIFYDRGWSGVNIEPSSYYYSLLQQHRARDINLQMALSDHKSEQDFFEVVGSGLSALDQAVIFRANAGGLQAKQSRVLVDTLTSVLDRHLKSRAIDFLKIDVEGHELQVIRGLDFQRYRPKVILVEAVHPDTRAPAWLEWEPILLNQNYVFASFDGLNRFYVDTPYVAWIDMLKLPPNVFDEFWLSEGHPMVKPKGRLWQSFLRRILPENLHHVVRRAYYHLLKK